jgi:hypothetical protein
MSGRSDDPLGLDLPELWRLLDDVEEGVADPTCCDELAVLLERSPAARRAYLEYFQQSAVLRMEAAKLRERGLLPVVGSAQQTRRAVQRSVLAAAALVTLAAVVAALITVARPEPARLAAAVAAETHWSVDGVEQASGDDEISVVEGSTVRVLSGTLRLEMESGGLLVVQGPAEVSFPALHRPRLRRGWLWIDAGKSDEPFQIETATLRIRDIGTRFGVRVAEDGMVEVHLVSGRVEVLAGNERKRMAVLKEGGKALAFSADGGMEEIPLAADPFPALPELLRRLAGYRTTVLGQSPAGYWMLDDDPGGMLSNEVAGSSTGFPGQAVRGGEPGLGVAGGFGGFAEDDRSLYLDGSRDRSAVMGIEGLHGVSRREGAVSFWVRRPVRAPRRDEILWLAGIGDEESPIPNEAILHTRLTSSGRVVFEIENEDDDVFLSSSRSISDGRWHQILASWGPSSVDLFIDGHLVARDSGKRTLKEGNFRGRYVRFGKPSRDLSADLRPFTGWVDEMALWDRALSAPEVTIQFRAARGQVEGK